MAQSPNNRASENLELLQELQLVAKVKAGDAAAFETLFRSYQGRLCRFAYSFVKSAETAKEIVQNLFQKIWENKLELHIKTSFKAYLYQSVKNLSLDYLKHQDVTRSYEETVTREPLSQKTLDEILNEKELLTVVQQAIERLPERCSLIFRMHWQDGLTYKEIAEVLNLSIKTIETQMGRALKSLRRHVAPYLSSFVLFRFFAGHLS